MGRPYIVIIHEWLSQNYFFLEIATSSSIQDDLICIRIETKCSQSYILLIS